MIDEIILSTWNNGKGAAPGVVKILDKAKKAVASYRAQGASQGGAANALWVVKPGITLPAGAYTIDMNAPEALDFDEAGAPVFYVGTSVPVVPPLNFTGTYKIWLDLYKTTDPDGSGQRKKEQLFPGGFRADYPGQRQRDRAHRPIRRDAFLAKLYCLGAGGKPGRSGLQLRGGSDKASLQSQHCGQGGSHA
jgi:hypothetical protein